MKTSGHKTKHGIKIRFINLISIIITAIVFCFILSISNKVKEEFFAMESIFEKVKICEKDSNILRERTEFLTEQARLFVATQKEQYAKSYIHEIFYAQTMTKAVDSIENECNSNPMAIKRLKNIFVQLGKLAEIEIYAIRLTYNSMNDKNLLKEIENIEIKPEHKNLSKAEQINIAMNLLFDYSYVSQKDRIYENFELTIEAVEQQIRKEFSDKTFELGESLKRLRLSYFILLIATVLIFVLFIVLIINPLKKIKEQIKNDETLNFKGAFELVEISERYNELHNIKANREKNLIIKAEYDELTGILNRRAFDRICAEPEYNELAVALLLIDMDNFKNINDSYGHAGGDTALKELARILKETFRTNDYIARIGGDEFAVIMINCKKSAKDSIKQKINSVNNKLSKIADDIKNVSVSVGVAFSDKGFPDQLFKNADEALYKVKEAGKHGCKFY